MAIQKTLKNKAYYKRYQVKYARRRSGKTDYRNRLKLSVQDKNKYNTPRYRLCARVTNRHVQAQIVYATIKGDITLCHANSAELTRYGIKGGLKNWAACYATGLLLARRVLKKLKLDEHYEGVEGDDVTGEDFCVEPADDAPRPFTAYLDVGLARTSTGAKVFGVLKGALDGGLSVPHNTKRFIGYEKEDKQLDAEQVQGYIFGRNVADYMEMLEEEEPDKYKSHFSKFIDEELTSEDLEDMYKEAHEKIRENPDREVTKKKYSGEKKNWKATKMTYDEKKANLKAKLEEIAAANASDDESDDE